MKKQKITKRSFLKICISAGIAPYIVPARVMGKQSPGNKINVGMIGVGRQGTKSNLKNFLNMNDVHIRVVCDVDKWRMDNAKKITEERYSKKYRTGYKGCDTTGDWREVLARKDIDAVMISTTDPWHAIMAVEAAKAGKDVCLEKPISLCIEESRAISDAMKKYNRICRTDTEFRGRAHFVKIVELVMNNYLGKIKRIETGTPKEKFPNVPNKGEMRVPGNFDYEMWTGPAPMLPYNLHRVHYSDFYKKKRPGWIRNKTYSDGMITNWGAHLNNIALWAVGLDRTGPVEIWGEGAYEDGGFYGVLKHFDINYKFANNIELNYKMNTPHVKFIGTDGWVGYNMKKLTASDPKLLRIRPKQGEIKLPLTGDKKLFIKGVKSRKPCENDAEVGHRVDSIGHLGEIAIQTGRKLKWDPKIEKFKNDDGANKMLGIEHRAPWKLLI